MHLLWSILWLNIEVDKLDYRIIGAFEVSLESTFRWHLAMNSQGTKKIGHRNVKRMEIFVKTVDFYFTKKDKNLDLKRKQDK